MEQTNVVRTLNELYYNNVTSIRVQLVYELVVEVILLSIFGTIAVYRLGTEKCDVLLSNIVSASYVIMVCLAFALVIFKASVESENQYE